VLNTAIPVNQRSPDVNTAVNNWNTLQAVRVGIVSGTQVTQNTSSANVYADYSVRDGRLKGLRLGGGVRYRGRTVIGNRAADTLVNPANAAQAIDDPAVDAYTPVYAPGYSIGTATIGYSLRILKRYDVSLNLRVENVFNDAEVRYTNTILRPPGGDVTNPSRVSVPNGFWYQPPRNYMLTATTTF
jgi:hypothetical protein